jgi:hypothetical protein
MIPKPRVAKPHYIKGLRPPGKIKRSSAMKKTIISLLALTALCLFSCKSPGMEGQYGEWKEAVVSGGQVFILLPAKLPSPRVDKRDKAGNAISTTIPDTPCPRILHARLESGKDSDNKAASCLLPLYSTSGVAAHRYSQDCPQDCALYPTVWDVSERHLFTISIYLGANELIYQIDRVPLDKLQDLHGKACKGGKISYLGYAKGIKSFAKGITFFSGQRAPVYYDLLAVTDSKIQLFLAQKQQFLVWEYDGQKWQALYAFSAEADGPFKVCQVAKKLYVLFEKGGIFCVDITKAKSKGPINVKEAKGNTPDALYWRGFDSASVKGKSVSARKVSGPKCQALIIDKDKVKAYSYSTETEIGVLINLEKLLNLPDVRPDFETDKQELTRICEILMALNSLDQLTR